VQIFNIKHLYNITSKKIKKMHGWNQQTQWQDLPVHATFKQKTNRISGK